MTLPVSRLPRNKTRVSTKHQVTIPKDVRDELHIKEGDVFQVADARSLLTKLPKGAVVLIPEKRRKPRMETDAEWNAKEAEADEDIAAGRVSGPFHSGEELIAHLHKASKKWRGK
jgi:AbrB family looped-hinge helix DNA binding protein